MEKIKIELDKNKLISGDFEIIAKVNSHVEGSYNKGDILKPFAVVGSLIRVRNNKGATSFIHYKNAEFKEELKREILCNSCGSFDSLKHFHNCERNII